MTDEESELFADLAADEGIRDAAQAFRNGKCAPVVLEAYVDKIAALACWYEREEIDVGEMLDDLSPETRTHFILCCAASQQLLATLLSAHLFDKAEADDD